MFEISAGFNPMIIDVALFVFLAIAFLIGFIKGFKKIFFRFLLVVISFVLAFTTTLGFTKKLIIDNSKTLILDKLTIQEPFFDYMIAMVVVLVVSILMYYVILFVLRFMIWLFKKAFRIKKKPKKLVNRLFGALTNSILSVIILAFTFTGASTPLLGFNEALEGTTVSIQIINTVETVMENETVKKVFDARKIVPKLLAGDVLQPVSDEDALLYGEVYERIVAIMLDPDSYYSPYSATIPDPVVVEELTIEMMNNIVVITDLAVLVHDEYTDIKTKVNDFMNNLISYIPAGTAVSIDERLETKLIANLDLLDIDRAVATGLNNIIGYVEA